MEKFKEEAEGIVINLDNKPTAIISWYNQPSNKGINLELLNWLKNHYNNFMILGDLNGHCVPWCAKEDEAGEDLQVFLDNSEAAILNVPGINTSIWNSQGARDVSSIIDLIKGTKAYIDTQCDYVR